MRALEPVEIGLSQAAVDLIHDEYGRLSPAQRAKGEDRWVARVAAPRGVRSNVAATAIALCAVVTLAMVFVDATRRERPALTVVLTGGHLGSEGAIESIAGDGPKLHFSDGSDVRLAAGAHASLRSVDGYGATVEVREGRAEVNVAHRPGARWSFEAGPFVIRVTGTAFHFSWDAPREEFDLHMERGSVEVKGPLTGGRVDLSAGEHLSVHLRQGETVVRDHEEEDAPVPAAVVPHPTSPTQPALESDGTSLHLPSPGRGGPEASPRPRSSWPALLASGAFDAIVSQARRRGLDTTLAHASSDDLSALGDAARYTREDEIARRALVTLQRRYGGSTSAREASFLLGRLEETEQNASGAVGFYERYVKEDPAGRYVSEALGRTMLLSEASPERARATAEEYLRRFPAGSYAARARALTQWP